MWNKISAESARQTSKRTHTQPTFVSTRSHYYSSLCYRAASLIHCVLPSLSRTVLPSSRRRGLTLFFLFFLVQFSLEQNRPPPAASCSRTQHFVPPSPSWWRRAGPPCCHSAASVCLSGSAWGWEEAFEQLCASRSSFLGLQRRPAVKMAKTQLCVMPDRPVAAMFDLDLGEL